MALILIEIVLIYSTFYLPGIIWQIGFTGSELPELTVYFLQYITVAVPQVFLLLYIIKIQKKLKFSDFGIRLIKISDISKSMLVYAGIFLMLVPLIIFLVALPETGQKIFNKGYRWKLQRISQLPLAILFCITTGYSEEIFFRSYLLTRLKQLGSSPYVSVILSSLLFAMGHLYQGYMGYIVAAIQGVYFSVVFLKRKNIHLTALAHSLYNFTVLMASLFMKNPLP
ncbi:MAG: CPBP family intramembrane metalloprotease [Spirochaetales bacterium]|nr:CPBP family intramembrane metalloprotease [Spirochaetales bacterium]